MSGSSRFMTWYLKRSSTTSKPQPQPTQRIRAAKHTEDRPKGRAELPFRARLTAHVDDQITAQITDTRAAMITAAAARG